MVRKIGVPWQPELALGAVVDKAEPQTVVNEEVERMVRPDPAYLLEETSRQLQEIERRRRLYRGDRPPIPVDGRTVVVNRRRHRHRRHRSRRPSFSRSEPIIGVLGRPTTTK